MWASVVIKTDLCEDNCLLECLSVILIAFFPKILVFNKNILSY